MRKTNIVAWNENWKALYHDEEKILKNIFANEAINIFHIGSTSIPTIGFAKPIIDLLIIVKDIESMDVYNKEMSAIGYEARNENGIKGRRYYTKGKEQRTHHVHIFQLRNEHINIHLNFKEYLLKHPKEAKQYGELKVLLAKQFPNDHRKYQDGKQTFVNELVAKANAWALQKNKE